MPILQNSFGQTQHMPFGLQKIASARNPSVSVQVLEEFYENLQNVGVSAATGEGMDTFFQQVQACAEEYRQLYLPELQKRQKVRCPCTFQMTSWEYL